MMTTKDSVVTMTTQMVMTNRKSRKSKRRRRGKRRGIGRKAEQRDALSKSSQLFCAVWLTDRGICSWLGLTCLLSGSQKKMSLNKKMPSSATGPRSLLPLVACLEHTHLLCVGPFINKLSL